MNMKLFIELYVFAAFVDTSAVLGSQELPSDRPLVIAHRGSSGQMPEHSLEAYQLAVQQGADVIECDLAVTKDLQLVCSHEPWLSQTTDVASRPEFADRERRYFIPSGFGFKTDFFTIDFTLKELKTLKRVQQRSYRDQTFNGDFSVTSFEDHIAVAKNTSNSKTVGIYPETKMPEFFNDFLSPNGTTMEDILLDVLLKHGYDSNTSPCFLQSFDVRSLQYMANRTVLPLVFLTSTTLPDEQLENLASYVTGIGPSKSVIVQVDPLTNKIIRTTDFVDRSHKYGLKVHPYTFRNEDQFLAYDYGTDPHNEYKMFIDLGVDGLFTDFPSSLSNYLDQQGKKDCLGGDAVKAKANFQIVSCFSLFLAALFFK